MHLKKIHLFNFRRFKGDNLLTFHRNLTVFAANNGAGKTSVLDGIALAFGAFLTRLPKISGNAPIDRDICIQRDSNDPYLILHAVIAKDDDCEATGESIVWPRIKVFGGDRKSRGLANHVADELAPKRLKEINAYADYLAESIESEIEFPVLAYYGTGRAILDIPQRRRGFGKDFPRILAYSGCLNPRTNFKSRFEYFYWLEDLERREKLEKGDLKYENSQLLAIREAICSFLHDRYTNPRTALRPLRFLLDDKKDGTSYSIEQLSDGYKTSLAMVMDIASRAVEANPHLGVSALKASGIVLIDEIELHLHPSWQQRIIPDLQRTFPNIQFICTTHSPQVLSTVKQESIRIITEDGTVMTGEEAGVNTYGAQSYIILEDLMNVSPNPRIPEVEELKDKLKRRLAAATIGIDDPEIVTLENMVGSKDPFLRNLKASILKSAKSHA